MVTSPSKLFFLGISVDIVYLVESMKSLARHEVVSFFTQMVSLKSPSLSVKRNLITKSLPWVTTDVLMLFNFNCGVD